MVFAVARAIAVGATCSGAARIARRLYLSDKAGADLLAALLAAGIAEADQGGAQEYFYSPQLPHLSGLIDQLAIIYVKNLVGVSTLIHSTTSRKAQRFADAFVLRKEP